MDTYINNDLSSLFKNEGSQFGEYTTTSKKKAKNIDSTYIPSYDVSYGGENYDVSSFQTKEINYDSNYGTSKNNDFIDTGVNFGEFQNDIKTDNLGFGFNSYELGEYKSPDDNDVLKEFGITDTNLDTFGATTKDKGTTSMLNVDNLTSGDYLTSNPIIDTTTTFDDKTYLGFQPKIDTNSTIESNSFTNSTTVFETTPATTTTVSDLTSNFKLDEFTNSIPYIDPSEYIETNTDENKTTKYDVTFDSTTKSYPTYDAKAFTTSTDFVDNTTIPLFHMNEILGDYTETNNYNTTNISLPPSIDNLSYSTTLYTQTTPGKISTPKISNSLNTGYTFGEYKSSKAKGVKSGTEIDTTSPIQVSLPPETITIKVPKIHKVVVPKIKKIYIPSKKKIYIKKPSFTSSNYSNDISYISSDGLTNENSITSMIDLSNLNPVPSISIVPNPIKKSSSSISMVPNPIKKSSSYISMVPNPLTKSSSSISMVPNPVVDSLATSMPIKSLVPEPVLSYKHMPKEQILVNSTIPESTMHMKSIVPKASMPMISQVPYPEISRHKSSKEISLINPDVYGSSTYKPLSRHSSSNLGNKIYKIKRAIYPTKAYMARKL